MNKALYFVGGLIFGALAGGVSTYLYMKKKVDEANNELNDYLQYNDISEEYDEETEDYEEDEVEVNSDENDDIKEKLELNYEKTTNYAAMYKGSASDYEHPVDSDEDEEDLALEATIEHRKNMTKKPKIISAEAAADLDAYIDHSVLLYYVEDEVLATENDEEITDPETFIGDALTKYGFIDNEDEEIIYVMNYELDTCYEIQKMEGTFASQII